MTDGVPGANRPAVSGARRFAAVILAALLSGGVLAEPPSKKGKDKAPPGQSREPSSQGASARFSDSSANHGLHRDLVSAGITAAAASLLVDDVGLSRSNYKPLPPGVRKNLARGKPLPPGIAKQSLPVDYVGRLPVYTGYEWIGAGTDLLLVEVGSRIIADVLLDVFR